MEGSVARFEKREIRGMPPVGPERTSNLPILNNLLLRLYDERHNTREGWCNCLEYIREHFQARQAVFLVRRRSNGDPSELIISGSEPAADSLRMFFDRYSSIDPFSNLPPDRACMIGDIISWDEWTESEFYKKYLSPQDILQVMGADIEISSEYVLAFRICRSIEIENFSDVDRDEFQFILPHLRRIAEARVKNSTLEANDRVFTDLMDCMDLGSVVLDQSGQVLRMNAAAERLLAKRDGVILANGALRATDYHDNQHFQKLIRQALHYSHDGGGMVGTIGLRRAESFCLLGVAVRSLAPENAVAGLRQATVSVLFGGSRAHDHISETAVKSIFSLTNAETRLAIALLKGNTIDEAAELMQVSRNTVRTHLNRLFLKTGTNRQSEVIRTLLGSIAAIC